MVCKCPCSYRNSPKIQLCPGQIWGGSGPALILRTRRVFLHGDRGYIHPANMSGVKKLEVNGDLLRKMIIMRLSWFIYVYYIIIYIYVNIYIYMCICVYICICICMCIYISLSMDAVKYRRTRGLTHLDDMGMHGLYRYTLTPCLSGDAILPKCSTHRQSPHHSGSDFAQVLQNELPIFCDSNPHASRLSNTQIIRVWYVCWGWKGSQKLWVISCISCI